MPKIGTITYPDDPMALLKDRNIGPLYKKHLTSVFNSDEVNFLQGKFDVKMIYKVYIQSNARKGLNLPSKMTADAKALADVGDWKLKSWQPLLADIEEHIINDLEMNHNASFFDSPAFLKLHALLLTNKEAKRIAKEVGTKDIKAIDNAIRALCLSETTKANKILKESQERERAMWEAKSVKEKPASLLSKIKKKLGIK